MSSPNLSSVQADFFRLPTNEEAKSLLFELTEEPAKGPMGESAKRMAHVRRAVRTTIADVIINYDRVMAEILEQREFETSVMPRLMVVFGLMGDESSEPSGEAIAAFSSIWSRLMVCRFVDKEAGVTLTARQRMALIGQTLEPFRVLKSGREGAAP